MRLIDADVLENVMTEDWFLKILINENDMENAIKNCIDSVPLAFDVKKVISQLRKAEKDNVISIDEAIKIVLSGGE